MPAAARGIAETCALRFGVVAGWAAVGEVGANLALRVHDLQRGAFSTKLPLPTLLALNDK